MKNFDCWYIDTCTEPDCHLCQTYFDLKWQMDNSGIPKNRQKAIVMRIDDSNRVDRDKYVRLSEIRKNIVDFVQSGKNLYICSNNTGNGKTSWAIKLLQTYFHYTAYGSYENLRGMFVNTYNLLLQLKDFKNPVSKEYRDNLINCDIVVWDDIAVPGLSQYDYTQLYSLINSRVENEKSNIYTSNVVQSAGLSDILDNRLMSRIYNESEIIVLDGSDRR